MDFERLKKLVEREHFTMKSVIKVIGLSEPGFYRAIKSESLRVTHIEKIAEAINISVCEFFQDPGADQNVAGRSLSGPVTESEWKNKYFSTLEKYSVCQEENSELKRQINFKQ